MKQERPKKTTSLGDVYFTAIEAFGYNKDKAIQWYTTKRPEYGNKSPYEMCKEGKSAAVLKQLLNAIHI